MKITVTQKHIDGGVACHSKGCALALAISEACPIYDQVIVGPNSVKLYPLLEGPVVELSLPTEARVFIRLFDNRRGPKPTSFELALESGGTPPRVRTSVYEGLETSNASFIP